MDNLAIGHHEKGDDERKRKRERKNVDDDSHRRYRFAMTRSLSSFICYVAVLSIDTVRCTAHVVYHLLCLVSINDKKRALFALQHVRFFFFFFFVADRIRAFPLVVLSSHSSRQHALSHGDGVCLRR